MTSLLYATSSFISAQLVRLPFFLFFLSPFAYCVDVVKIVTPQSGNGKKTAYKRELLTKALAITEEEFGPFVLNSLPLTIYRTEAINVIENDSYMNVVLIPANEEWDNKTIPIEVPIRGGTLSYRLLLVHKDQINDFKNVTTLSELSALTAGLQTNWVTTQLLTSIGAKTASSKDIDDVFIKLKAKHVDYIPRAIYEASNELAVRSHLFEHIVIEPSIALFIPMVSYFYVSPKHPKIAKRLTAGLNKLAYSGELRALFEKYFIEDIKRADLGNRRLIEVPNPYFNDKRLFNKSNTENNHLIWRLH